MANNPTKQKLPSWYRSEADERAAQMSQAPQAQQAIPDWLREMDAQDAPKLSADAAPNPNAPVPDWLLKMDALPDWYVPETQDNPAAAAGPLPDWYTPEPETVTSSAEAPRSDAGDILANAATGVARVPGAIIGLPHLLGHTMNWGQAQMDNALNYFLNSKAPHETGADLDARDPVMKVLPSAQDVDKRVFQGISALAGRDVQPYEPESFFGKLGQAAITGGLGGFLDPLAAAGAVGRGAPVGKALLEGGARRAGQTALAADAANATQQAFPDQPGLAALAALAAHGGSSAIGAVARGGGGGVAVDAARQVFRPGVQGEREAGRVLQRVDNTLPGLARPGDAEMDSAGQSVRSATDAIGPGLPDHMAGANLRSGLQARVDALKGERAAQADKAFEGFRNQPPLPASELTPFMRSPSFKKAVGAANASVLDEGGEPLTKFWDFDEGDAPRWLSGEAVPPDVLHRVKTHLSDAVRRAEAGSAEERTATMLHNRFSDFMESAYPRSDAFPGYAAIRKQYADASRPLDPATYGPVAKVLETEKQFGKSRYVLPEERVPDTFLRSKASRTDLNQLVDAFGGDKTAALSALEDHLAGVAQTAIRPDGTMDVAAFEKAMKPYRGALPPSGMWFPGLTAKFTNAKAAQATLEKLQHQRSLAEAVEGGALRDNSGAITGPSFAAWIKANRDTLARTQDNAAILRLETMARALKETRPGELADVLKSEIAPTVAGTALGGLEGGVLATLLHKSAQSAFGRLDATRQDAFASAIEKAAMDPAYAKRLATEAARRGKGVSPMRALVRAVAATPLAVNVGSP